MTSKPARKRHKRLPPETCLLIRRLTLIEMRTALPADLVATIFGVTPALVHLEVAKGYPADLEPALARATIESVREALAWWAERERNRPSTSESEVLVPTRDLLRPEVEQVETSDPALARPGATLALHRAGPSDRAIARRLGCTSWDVRRDLTEAKRIERAG